MNENPFAQDLFEPNSSQPTLKLPYLKSWVVFYLSSLLLGLGAGALVGFVIGFIMGMAGADLSNLQIFGGVFGFIVGLPISFLCYRWSIEKYILPAATARTSEL